MAGCIKVIFSLLLVCIISSNTADWNRKLKLRPRHKRIFKRYGTTPQNKGHGQICITWGGINGVSVFLAMVDNNPALLIYLLRFSPEYKYFFNGYVGIVSRVGALDGCYRDGAGVARTSILSLGVGLEWSYNGTGNNSRIDNTYYGGSMGVLGLWGDMVDVNSHKIKFEFDGWDVQVRLTPFNMRKPNGLYMSVDFVCLGIKGLGSGQVYQYGIIEPTAANIAFNIGWSWCGYKLVGMFGWGRVKKRR